MVDLEKLNEKISHSMYLDALAAARLGHGEKMAELLANGQQPIPREVMTYLANVQMGFEKSPKRVGMKPKRTDFALRPNLLHSLINDLIYWRKADGKVTNPVEAGIADAAKLTGLGRDTLDAARKGVGPYQKRNLWKRPRRV